MTNTLKTYVQCPNIIFRKNMKKNNNLAIVNV